MSTNDSHSLIASTLFGKSRRRILGLLFTNVDRKFYVRDIIRKVDCGQSSVQRELVKLENAGLINMEATGQHLYFSANKSCPVYAELHNLFIKTYGLADVLKSAFEKISDRIEFAFIFGSIASGIERKLSDIDLMIIGDASSLEINKALREAKSKIMREINCVDYSREGFRESVKKIPFLQIVQNGPVIMLIGDENELKGMG
ncbi:nucleotidyltransferase domain-containing protein [bacterium]|nr:nucleotidyltransferase domain-containing protein [bacterium]MBU1024879.1 nucleotidyltransferase domain-containing protein [bacterium]